MDIKDLNILIKMVAEYDISELEMEDANGRVVIKRGKNQESVPVTSHSPLPPVPSAPESLEQQAPAPAEPARATVSVASGVDKNYETVTAPIVGTFYRGPSREAAPYVEVGTIVEKGHAYCTIEAMMIMNDIEAVFTFKVVEILKESGQPVEFGEPLFLVERL